ncbi:hypothetical protein AK830_g6275 [Neonectria ditissima]|uniref:DUF6546 domain-containing protein n=1 Tax=Neonectria ditissima TaxID=78410 RepID=A0A0P7BIZ4_9HYPO|nr:hypothetical protein AK830_g6275 [Neonectria ditissima]
MKVPAKPLWNSLPPEIHLHILELFIADNVKKNARASVRGQKKLGVALFATVCREWQFFFEKFTFRRLVLDASALPAFATATRGHNVVRLTYIRHLWLRMKLLNYTCRSCSKPENALTISRNNRVFTSAIESLLCILSRWEPQHGPGGLTLEISAHSPSDLRHRFRDYRMEDDYPYQLEEDLKIYPGLFMYHVHKSRRFLWWNFSHRTRRQRMGDMQRLYGTPLELKPWPSKNEQGHPNEAPTLAKAPIVKGFLIRHQCYRSFAVTTLATIFEQSLIAVTSFRFETRTPLTAKGQLAFTDDLRMRLVPAFPRSLRRFYFNQWPARNTWLIRNTWQWDTRWKEASKYLARDMATSCSNLTEFCPAWDFDVREFLAESGREPASNSARWAELELLALRAPEYCRTQDYVMILLQLAGIVAKNMPKLRIMEIWNDDNEFPYLFRYTFDHGEATITWRCTAKNWRPTAEVINNWSDVASRRDFLVRYDEEKSMLMTENTRLLYRRLTQTSLTEIRIDAGKRSTMLTSTELAPCMGDEKQPRDHLPKQLDARKPNLSAVS